jgi:hypothetical protein
MDKFLKVFVDDLNICIMLWEKHLEHFLLVLMKLKEVKLKLNFNKCEFVKTNIGLLQELSKGIFSHGCTSI